jgi:transposase-like protein
MPRRQWDTQTTARIVREGLQGKSIAAPCHEYHLNQSQYDPWRDPWLANASKALEVPQDAQQDVHRAPEHAR